jgi:hypothetical protein
MGVGKTLIGGSTAIAIAASVVEKLRGQIADDQVVLIVAPPHLVEKWKRERDCKIFCVNGVPV